MTSYIQQTSLNIVSQLSAVSFCTLRREHFKLFFYHNFIHKIILIININADCDLEQSSVVDLLILKIEIA